MSIADRISSMANNLSSAYGRIAYLGVDTSSIDKNIQNLSTVLDTVYNDYPKVSDEGTNPSLEGSKVGRLSTVLKGNTSKDGTSTPDNPVDINVVKGENSVTVCEKNFFDVNVIQERTTNGITMTITGQTINLKGTPSANANFYMKTGETISLPAGTYFIIRSSLQNIATLKLQSGSDTIIATGSTDISFTLNNDTTIDGLTLQVPSAVGTIDEDVTLQINLGSTAIPYSPYTGITLPITLPTGLELCKMEDYQDYIYRENGNWYKHNAIGKVVLNGSENWSINNSVSTNDYKVFYCYVAGMYKNSLVLSNNFIYESKRGINNCIYTPYQNELDISIDSTLANDTATFKIWLSTHNTTVYYVLATPTSTQITDTTLINQLNALYDTMSYNGQTNILQTNADLPFIIQASALKGA